MTFKQLEYFLTIAKTENITRASEILNISQPPLSLQLKALEDEFQVQLFHRNKKNLTITKKGLLLQERATEILNLVNGTIYDLQAPDSGSETIINIGVISSVSHKLLPNKIAEYKKINPSVHFSIYEGSTTTINDQLTEGYIDIGIIREPFNMTSCGSLPLKNLNPEIIEMDYFVALGHPSFFDNKDSDLIDLIDLRGKSLIMQRRYHELWTNNCRKKGFIPDLFCLNTDASSSIALAEAEAGIAILPYSSASNNFSHNLISKKITDPTISSDAHLVWSLNRQISPEAKSFIQLFKNNIVNV